MPPVPQYIATLMSDLARLEGKVDNFIGQMGVQDTRTTALALEMGRSDKELEKRIGKVENRQHWYAGAGTVAGLILGAFGEFFTGHAAH